MTIAQALYSFWSGFGVSVYEENSVPSGDFSPSFPYITYEISVGEFGSDVAMSASYWDRTNSLSGMMEKENEIFSYIGRGGVHLPCDGGVIWIKRGEPFSDFSSDSADSSIKRLYLNIVAEYQITN